MKHCITNVAAIAPDPDKWELIDCQQFKNAYVLQARYKNCSNFEGIKIMVYRGNFTHQPNLPLDPHFDRKGLDLLARFRPDMQGIMWAVNFAKSISEVSK